MIFWLSNILSDNNNLTSAETNTRVHACCAFAFDMRTATFTPHLAILRYPTRVRLSRTRDITDDSQ